MLCNSPVDYGHGYVACGQCTACRINHKLRWMGRMALEQRYGFPGMPGAFITLTYDDDNLPQDGSVSRKDLKVFLDDMRRNIGTTERYFAVAEYGELSFRPHYHIIHFGAFGNDAWSKIYANCWKKGIIDVRSAEGAVASYVTGYVTKKLDQGHQAALEERGLAPEFFSQSRRPPLGDTGLTAIANQLNTNAGARLIAEHGFPRGFHLSGRYYPFFRRDRLVIVKRAGYDQDLAEEHLQRVTERADFYIEEMEIHRQAEAWDWTPERLALKLQSLKEEQHGKEIEQEIERARARAAKFRRRIIKTKGHKALAGGRRRPNGTDG